MNSRDLVARMTEVSCAAGETQLERVLSHAIGETRRAKVNALVFVGDAMEENDDRLTKLAGELGLLGVERIARLSGGAYCPFDAGSAELLRDLLAAVATFAVGGRPALEDFAKRRGGELLRLTRQVGKPRAP